MVLHKCKIDVMLDLIYFIAKIFEIVIVMIFSKSVILGILFLIK